MNGWSEQGCPLAGSGVGDGEEKNVEYSLYGCNKVILELEHYPLLQEVEFQSLNNFAFNFFWLLRL